MQHLSRYWNVARHRMPPECEKVLHVLIGEGKLEILKGRLKNIETVDEKFNIKFSQIDDIKDVSVDAIINCIGSESNFARVEFPLVKNLVAKGLIKTDELNLGINALPDGRTLDEFGSVSEKIFTIGTALKGVLWESTAMPEIRAQANKLAQSLLEEEMYETV
jgi:uncharacterized NAD(P)/FAD-binding protein YdhS